MHRRWAGEGKYARVEREQRWTVGELPRGAQRAAEIVDRYISGTRLRLRQLRVDDDVVFKLGQKVRTDPQNPELVKVTNMYLSPAEYEILSALPAAELVKTRWQVTWDRRTVAVDVLHERLRGLILAETELAPDEPQRPTPPFAIREVTSDDRFSGGALANASHDEIIALMRDAQIAATP